MSVRSLLGLAALAAASLPSNDALMAPSSSSSSPRIRTRPLSDPLATSDRLAFPSPPARPLESSVEEALDEALGEHAALNAADEADGLSPFLRGMVDEQREFRTNVGKAMDVLRTDYPYFLKRAPDYSIYHDRITLSASDGQIQLSKLSSYKKAFGVVRNILPLLYDADRSVIQSRIHHDAARSQIRVSFNAMLVPKMPMGGKTVHVDGVSAYALDATPTANGGEGKIVEHKLERLLVNGASAQPPYFAVFGMESLVGQRAGALAGAGAWSCTESRPRARENVC